MGLFEGQRVAFFFTESHSLQQFVTRHSGRIHPIPIESLTDLEATIDRLTELGFSHYVLDRGTPNERSGSLDQFAAILGVDRED